MLGALGPPGGGLGLWFSAGDQHCAGQSAAAAEKSEPEISGWAVVLRTGLSVS